MELSYYRTLRECVEATLLTISISSENDTLAVLDKLYMSVRCATLATTEIVPKICARFDYWKGYDYFPAVNFRPVTIIARGTIVWQTRVCLFIVCE